MCTCKHTKFNNFTSHFFHLLQNMYYIPPSLPPSLSLSLSLRFIGHFPGEPELAGVTEERMMEVVVTTGLLEL